MPPARTVEIRFLGSARQLEETLASIGIQAEAAGKKIGDHLAAGASRAGNMFQRVGAGLASFGVPLAGSVSKVGDHLSEAEGKGKNFGAAMAEVGKVATIGLAGGLAVGAAEAVKLGASFQSSMTLIQTQAHDTTDNLQAMSRAVLAMAGPTATAPEQLAAGLYHLTSVGLRGAQALNTLKVAAEGAKVGHANLEDVTKALAGAVSSGIPGVENMSQAMGALNAVVGAGDMRMQDLADAMGTGVLAVVKTMGLSLNDAGAALATFGDNNIRGADAATMLRMAVQAMAKPLASTTQGAKDLAAAQKAAEAADKAHAAALQHLNDLQTIDAAKKKLSVADNVHLADAQRKVADAAQAAADAHDKLNQTQAAGNVAAGLGSIGLKPDQLRKDLQSGGLNKALSDLREHLNAAGITGNKVGAFILDAFGKKQATGITVLLDNFDKLQSKYKVVGEGANKFGQDWQTTTHTMQFQMEQLRATVTALGTRIGTALIPWVERAAKAFEHVTSWLEKHRVAALTLASVIGGVLAVAIGAFVASLSPVILIAAGVGAAIAGLVVGAQYVADHWHRIWGDIAGFFETVWHGIEDGIRHIVDVFLGMVGTIVHAAASAFGWVPGIGGHLKAAAKAFDDFKRSVDASLGDTNAQFKQATDQMAAFNAQAQQSGQAIRQVSVGAAGTSAQFHTGGAHLAQFADGGMVSGPAGAPQVVVAHGGEVIGYPDKLPALLAQFAPSLGRTAGEAPAGPLSGMVGNTQTIVIQEMTVVAPNPAAFKHQMAQEARKAALSSNTMGGASLATAV